MFKSILTICFGVTFFMLSATQGWSGDQMEDRFINPDISTSKNIFIDVKDVSLVDVLKIISKQSGLSFIAAQDVKDRRVTLYLNKVPLNQALQTILDANDLTYQMQSNGNVFVIMTKWKTEKTKITRVYQLKYATVSSSKLNTTLTFSGGTSTGTSTSTSSASSGTTATSSSSAGGLEQAINDALSPDGKVIEDPRTNSLIITDVPAQFEIIESTIAKLDVPVPQILIEVEMLDVSKSVGDQIGIAFGATPISFQGAQKAVNYPFSTSHAIPSSTSSSSSSASSSSSNTGTSPFTAGMFNATTMTAELNFLSTQTDARTLARPRILTLNNQTAQIEISTDQAISIQQVSSSTTVGSSTNTVAPERVTTGVILRVTPQANLLTREIIMAVSPKVIDVILSQVQQTGSGATPIYDPETRGSDSLLELKDGQSMVIGGLMTNQYNNKASKIPFLGDLPVIGAAFRYSNKTKAERELIIFLTPHIIDENNQTALLENKPLSVQTALDIQNASDRAQEINNSLNNLDVK